MITRHRASWLAVATVCLMSTLACQRVPLLAPSGSTITLTTTTTALPVNGTTRLVAQILEPAGTPPHSGTHVTFTTTLGTIQPAETETDINGQATAMFVAGTASGTATITAISGGANVGSSGALKILVGTAAVGKVVVNANPTTVPALGGSSTITSTVFDVNGNVLVAAPVSFSTTAGALSTTFATTDNNGAAQVVLTTNVQATVTASVGAQGSTTTPPPTTGGGAATPTTPTSGQASGTVTVTVAGSPTLVIAPPATLSAGLPSVFTITAGVATANGSPIRQVTINWGDRSAVSDLGAINGATSVAHVYGSPGTYVIVGTITDAFGSVVNVSITVTVNPKPQPVVTLSVTTTNPTAGTDVAFTSNVAVAAGSPGSVIQSTSIDFGDGTVTPLGAAAGAISLHHVYQTGGNYTVALTATDSNGGIGTGVTTIFVQAATPLGVSLTYTKTDVNTTNALATFTATVTGLGNGVVIQYLWDFGDNSPTQTTTTNQITHNYTKASPAQTLVAKVTVTTSDNRTTSGTATITP